MYVHVCMYNYRQEIVYFVSGPAIIIHIVFILTGGPGSNKRDLVDNL